MMKVFITGGTGFVGTYLSRRLVQEGHQVTILTRRSRPPAPTAPGISYVVGDPTQEGPWMGAVAEHDWIINLAGASIFTRWSAGHKQEIFDSRVRTTRNLVIALAQGDRRQLFCSTSAVGYYGPRGEETLTEESPADAGFLGDVSKAWEAEALKAQELGVRTVITRFGIVLGKGGGRSGITAGMNTLRPSVSTNGRPFSGDQLLSLRSNWRSYQTSSSSESKRFLSFMRKPGR